MKNNILSLQDKKKKKIDKKVLTDFVHIFTITKTFYENLRPYLKYRIVYSLAKNILDFRDSLNYEIRILKSKVTKEKDNEEMEP